MSDFAGYGFTYNPGDLAGAGQPEGAAPQGAPQTAPQGVSQQPMELFAWQVCLAHIQENSLEDADNYADYAINRGSITQMLGLGMASGQNACEFNGQLFVLAISIQVNGQIKLIDASYPRYNEIAVVVAEQLLRGDDHGMVALLPNGNLVPFVPPTPAADL